jgi:hypothetical protein
MAKKKAAAESEERGSKAAIIKELIAAGKSNKEIHAEVAARGIKISPNYVSVVKSGMGLTRKRRKRKGAKANVERTTSGSAGPNTNSLGPANGFAAAISFCRSVGGIKQAKKLIETLEEIKSL